MAKVVKIQDAAKEKAAQRTGGSPRPGDLARTALVLGGGGVTGGVYEIGALRALDLLAVNRTINQFDVYVGTSAGSMIASLAANGVTPEEMMRVVNRQVPTPFEEIDLGTLLRPNYGEFLRRGALQRLGAPALSARGPRRARPHRRLPSPAQRAPARGHRPRHLRAHRAR